MASWTNWGGSPSDEDALQLAAGLFIMGEDYAG